MTYMPGIKMCIDTENVDRLDPLCGLIDKRKYFFFSHKATRNFKRLPNCRANCSVKYSLLVHFAGRSLVIFINRLAEPANVV